MQISNATVPYCPPTGTETTWNGTQKTGDSPQRPTTNRGTAVGTKTGRAGKSCRFCLQDELDRRRRFVLVAMPAKTFFRSLYITRSAKFPRSKSESQQPTQNLITLPGNQNASSTNFNLPTFKEQPVTIG
mgnify:FL=1